MTNIMHSCLNLWLPPDKIPTYLCMNKPLHYLHATIPPHAKVCDVLDLQHFKCLITKIALVRVLILLQIIFKRLIMILLKLLFVII